MQLSYNRKRNPCGYTGIEKFLIFLGPKTFLIQTDCKGIHGFVKKNLPNMQVQGRLVCWQLWLNNFFSLLNIKQGSKNSLTNSLTHELANDDHHSRISALKRRKSKMKCHYD